MALYEGRLVDLVLFAGFCLGIWMATNRYKQTGMLPIRKVTALDAFDEAIGRATELGRPIHYTVGRGLFDAEHGAQTFAGFSLLKHTAQLAVKYGARLIVTNQSAQAYPVTEEIVRQAYIAAGNPDGFNPNDVRYLSEEQGAYVSGVIGVMERDKIAANVMIGYFYAESMMLAETGSKVGAIQIAGTANTHQTPFFVAACDYTLIGEEVYAASAYIEKQPIQLGCLVAQDYFKYLAGALMLGGTLMSTLGVRFLSDLMKR